jgi:hypothetical protein
MGQIQNFGVGGAEAIRAGVPPDMTLETGLRQKRGGASCMP